MKKHFLFAALFLAALSIGFIACDNDDDPRLDNDDDNTENVVDGDSINNIEGEDDYYNCDSTEMVCTGKAYDITGTTAKVAATVHIPLTLLAQCQLGVQVSSSKEDLMAHENVTNFTSKNLTGNDFVVNLENLKSNATTHYYCAYIFLNGIYHYGLIREFNTLCILNKESVCINTGKGSPKYDCVVEGGEAGSYAPGTEITLKAISGEHWDFHCWDNNKKEDSIYTITITSDTTVIAEFKTKPYLKLDKNILYNRKLNSIYYGHVYGQGYYDIGTEVTIGAVTDCEFAFKGWSDNNQDNSRTITINKDESIVAYFGLPTIEVPPTCTDVVDLGLPSGVKWAACNIGASSPEEYGSYFACGELHPKTIYTYRNYVGDYILESINWQNGYCNFQGREYLGCGDAAHEHLHFYYMPTSSDIAELKRYCTHTWTDDYNGTGVAGVIIASKTNDNHIFIPAAGFKKGEELSAAGELCFFRSCGVYKPTNSDPRFEGIYSCRYDSSYYYVEEYFGTPIRLIK